MSLSSLPTELILHLFKSFDEVNAAAVLSQTSRHFHTIWRYNLTSICDAVLPKIIDYHSHYCRLAEARAKSDAKSDGVVNQSSVDDRAEAAIARARVRARVMFNDVDLVDYALEQFKGDTGLVWGWSWTTTGRLDQCACIPPRTNRRRRDFVLEQFSYDRFSEGFLRAMSILYLAGKGGTRMYKFLTSMNLLDFFAMVEVMEWYVCDYDEYPDTCEDIQVPGYDSRPWRDEIAPPRGYLAGRSDVLNFLEVLRAGLVEVSGVKPPSNDRFQTTLGSGLVSFQLILHKDCKRYNTAAAESFALADLLPLLPDNCSVSPDYELSIPH